MKVPKDAYNLTQQNQYRDQSAGEPIYSTSYRFALVLGGGFAPLIPVKSVVPICAPSPGAALAVFRVFVFCRRAGAGAFCVLVLGRRVGPLDVLGPRPPLAAFRLFDEVPTRI